MITTSYNLSQKLKNYLEEIDILRRKIILAPLPPRVEIRLKWDAMVDRIYYSLNLAQNPLTKTQMEKILTTQIKPKLKAEEREVIKYKKTFDQISFDWLVSQKNLTSRETQAIFEATFPGSLRVSDSSLKRLLDYAQVNAENPIIQAGLIQLEVIRLAPFTRSNEPLARLLSYLLLYKSAYDFRGLLVIEEPWKRDQSYRENVKLALQTTNLTLWLEFFASTVADQLHETYKRLTSPAIRLSSLKSYADLTERQREILNFLDEPGSTITNRKVQSLFGVSQITSSRDLTKLASLNLIFPKGKGRSISYGKA